MTLPLTRPLLDNPILQESSDFRVGMGTVLRNVISQPFTTGLLVEGFKQAQAGQSDYTQLQKRQLYTAAEQFNVQSRALNFEINSLPMGPERQAKTQELVALRDKFGAYVKAQQEQSISEGRLLDQKTLEKQFGDTGLKFDRPMTPEEAKMRYDNKQAELIRNAIIANGPSGVFTTVAKLSTSMLAMATDPIELASMFIPVVGEAKTAALVDRFGAIGGRAIAGSIEGLVGSAITEPLYYSLATQQQLDYTMRDALINVAMGGALGGAIGGLAGSLGRLKDGKIKAEKGTTILAKNETTILAEPRNRAEMLAQRQSADIAIRQFVNDQTVSVADVIHQRLKTDIQDIEKAIVQQEADVAKQFPEMRFKYPLAEMVKGIGGVKYKRFNPVTQQHELTQIASELAAMGVTPKTHPFIWRKNGLETLDGLPASEHQGLAQVLGTDGAGYLDHQKLTEALGQELSSGKKTPLSPEIQDQMRLSKGLMDHLDQANVALNQHEASKSLAKHAQDIANDPIANPQASQSVNMDFLTAEELAQFDEIKSLVDNQPLNKEEQAILKQGSDSVTQAAAFGDMAKIAANCILRA